MVLFASYTSEMQLEGKLLFMEGMLGSLYLLLLLPRFQIFCRFDFFKFIYFAIYLDVYRSEGKNQNEIHLRTEAVTVEAGLSYLSFV